MATRTAPTTRALMTSAGARTQACLSREQRSVARLLQC
jgi:hypothetical protein